jgi:hypothetical protein
MAENEETATALYREQCFHALDVEDTVEVIATMTDEPGQLPFWHAREIARAGE